MPVMMEEVRAALEPEEPDYERAAGLGEEALPLLAELAGGREPLLAAKATYLASLIGGPEAAAVLLGAANHVEPTVRASAAAAVRNLPPELALRVLDPLLADGDSGVRRMAVRSAAEGAAGEAGDEVRERLRALGRDDPHPGVRAAARRAARRE